MFILNYTVNIMYEHTYSFTITSWGIVAISVIVCKMVTCYKEVKVSLTGFTNCIAFENCFDFFVYIRI